MSFESSHAVGTQEWMDDFNRYTADRVAALAKASQVQHELHASAYSIPPSHGQVLATNVWPLPSPPQEHILATEVQHIAFPMPAPFPYTPFGPYCAQDDMTTVIKKPPPPRKSSCCDGCCTSSHSRNNDTCCCIIIYDGNNRNGSDHGSDHGCCCIHDCCSQDCCSPDCCSICNDCNHCIDGICICLIHLIPTLCQLMCLPCLIAGG